MAKGGARPGAGRKPGSRAQHTVQAEAAKARLVELFLEEKDPIFRALIKSAKEGYTPAIKELLDRVWGKVTEPIEIAGKDGLPFVITIKQTNGQA